MGATHSFSAASQVSIYYTYKFHVYTFVPFPFVSTLNLSKFGVLLKIPSPSPPPAPKSRLSDVLIWLFVQDWLSICVAPTQRTLFQSIRPHACKVWFILSSSVLLHKASYFFSFFCQTLEGPGPHFNTCVAMHLFHKLCGYLTNTRNSQTKHKPNCFLWLPAIAWKSTLIWLVWYVWIWYISVVLPKCREPAFFTPGGMWGKEFCLKCHAAKKRLLTRFHGCADISLCNSGRYFVIQEPSHCRLGCMCPFYVIFSRDCLETRVCVFYISCLLFIYYQRHHIESIIHKSAHLWWIFIKEIMTQSISTCSFFLTITLCWNLLMEGSKFSILTQTARKLLVYAWDNLATVLLGSCQRVLQ